MSSYTDEMRKLAVAVVDPATPADVVYRTHTAQVNDVTVLLLQALQEGKRAAAVGEMPERTDDAVRRLLGRPFWMRGDDDQYRRLISYGVLAWARGVRLAVPRRV